MAAKLAQTAKRSALGLSLGGYAALLWLFVAQGSDRPPYDDSYFFKRFALNFLDHGLFAWNVDEGPVYGNTSQLQQLIVTLIAAVTRTRTLSVLRVLLAAALFAGLAVMLGCARRYGARNAALLAFCSPVALFCVLSGMETALVFALLALFLSALELERHWAIAPGLCVVLWLARPDTLLLTLPLWWLASRPDRSRWLRGGLLIGGGIAAGLLVFRLGYGSALPLPFYAKQRAYSPYDPQFLELSRSSAAQRFGVFVWAAAPLALLALARRDGWNVALLGSALGAGVRALPLLHHRGHHGHARAVLRAGAPALGARSQPRRASTRCGALALWLGGAVRASVCGLVFRAACADRRSGRRR